MHVVQPNIFLYFFLLILGISGFFFAVIWPQAIGFYVFIAFAAAGGFGVSLYIYYTKKQHKQLVCPIGSNCNVVINSRFSKFLGVPLEYFGMFYYSVIFVSYILLIFTPHLLSELLLSGLIILTAAAFFFSLYLLFVQAFLLWQWCIWCLLSAMLSITIFITSLVSVDFAVAFLAEISTIIGAIHAFGFALGIGGVTVVLFLFSRFLHDRDIDEGELKTLKGISELVLLGLVFVLVSQFVSFVAHAEALAKSGLFLIQTIALFVAAVSGAMLMIVFAPYLAVMPFSAPGGSAFGGNETEKDQRRSPLEFLRRPMFLTGAVALSSWYFAFSMNYLPECGLSVLFSVYVTVIAVAIVIALYWEKSFSRVKI